MDDPLPPDPYKALGIAKDAPLATVRSAHRKLVLTCHPDKVADESAKKVAADKFHLVQQAYEILSDETRRQRYDERVKLAALRADVMSQKGGRIIPEMAPRTRTTTFEMRGDRMYEERVPRRSYDEEEGYFPPHYQEVRPKRYDDRSFVQTPRRTSGRASEDKRRAKDMARDFEEERDRRRKEAARADERAVRSERNKRRDKEKRRDSEARYRSKQAYVEDTDSDSDVTERIYTRREDPASRRYGDEPRRPELPRRSTTREVRDLDDDYDTKQLRAQDYIAQSRGSVEPGSRRPLPTRSYTHVEARPPVTPKVPPMPVDTSGRHPSGRGNPRREPSPPPRLSKKDRKMTEIVDPPSSGRRPSLPNYPSDPKGFKVPPTPGRKEAHRSQTLDSVPETRAPTIKRAETMPLDRSRRSENQPSRSSKLKESHDSGYSSRSSRGTPDHSPTESPRMKSTRYQYVGDGSTDSEGEDTIVAEPEGYHKRVREVSPKARRPPLTPQSASRMQMPPMRSGSSAMHPDQPPTPRTAPPIIRTESGRPPPRTRPSARSSPGLFGEVPPSDDLPYRVMNQSPKFSRDDIKYSPRRGSDDLDRVDRDSYPSSHHRPGLSRNESRAVHA